MGNQIFCPNTEMNYDRRLRDYKQLQQDAILDEELKILASQCKIRLQDRKENVHRAKSSPRFCSFLKEEKGVVTIQIEHPPKSWRIHVPNCPDTKYYKTAQKLRYKSSKQKWYVSRFNRHMAGSGFKFIRCEDDTIFYRKNLHFEKC